MTGKLEPFDGRKTKKELGGEAVATALNSIPYLGPIAGKTYELVVGNPLEKRRREWDAQLVATINGLVEAHREVTPERLARNEAFVSAVARATRIAGETRRQDKRQLLLDVVHQIGSGIVLNDVLEATFFSILERYTATHIELLAALTSLQEIDRVFKRAKSLDGVELSFESSRSGKKARAYLSAETIGKFLLEGIDAQIAGEIYGDLHRDRLCYGSEGFSHSYYQGSGQELATDRGKAFLQFVGRDVCAN